MISVRSEVQVLPGPPFYGSCAAWLSRKRARRPFGLAMPLASFSDLSIVCERPAGPQARTRAANFFASGLPARGIRWGRSSVGRAVALQASGRRFDPVRLHQNFGSPNAFIDGSGKPDPAAGSTIFMAHAPHGYSRKRARRPFGLAMPSASREPVHTKQSFAFWICHAMRVDEVKCGFQDIVKRKHIRMIPGRGMAAMSS